jgi:hypothetical protein
VKDMFQMHFVNCERFGSEGVESKLFELSDGGSVALPSAAHPPRIEAVASISFVKTEDYNRCCVHHVRLHRRR